MIIKNCSIQIRCDDCLKCVIAMKCVCVCSTRLFIRELIMIISAIYSFNCIFVSFYQHKLTMKKNEYFNSNAFFMADIPFNENKIAMHFNI